MAASLQPDSFFASARRSVRSNCPRQSRLPSYFNPGKTTTIVGERPNSWRKRDEARTRTFAGGNEAGRGDNSAWCHQPIWASTNMKRLLRLSGRAGSRQWMTSSFAASGLCNYYDRGGRRIGRVGSSFGGAQWRLNAKESFGGSGGVACWCLDDRNGRRRASRPEERARVRSGNPAASPTPRTLRTCGQRC